MDIEQHIWGMTPEGEAAVLYVMRNASGAEVRLSTYGAAVVAVRVPDRQGRIDDVVLGYKRFEDYIGDPAAMGKSAGRCAGRIAYGRMQIEGTEYRLDANSGGNHLHGGSKGFADRNWEGRVETNRVVMSLTSDDGDQGYPGTLAVEAVFDFDEDNALEITYLARTDKTTVVNLTNLVCFNLAGEGAGCVLDHELRLRASGVLDLDAQQIPTGQRLDVTGTPADFRSFRAFRPGMDATFGRIRDFGGYDHFFPLDGWQSGILAEAGELRDPLTGRTLTVLTSQPGVQVYTGNRLAGGCPETKSGGRYADHAGVTLACQHYPDAVNHPEFPSPLLHPGELYCQKTVYRFGTGQQTSRSCG